MTARLACAEHVAKRISDLSGGQRKRVSIAIELLANPSVLFLDEPSSGLDPATEEALMTLLQSLTLTKLTVVCTTPSTVVQKAYLFDRLLLCRVAGLVFDGNSEMKARRHFLFGDAEQDSSCSRSCPRWNASTPVWRILVKPAAEWETEFGRIAICTRAFPLIAQGTAPEAGQLKTLR